MKNLAVFIFLLLCLNLSAQKNKNNLKLSFNISESNYLSEYSMGYDFRYERDIYGILNVNIGYGHNEAVEINDSPFYYVSSFFLVQEDFLFEEREHSDYLDANLSVDIIHPHDRFQLKFGAGLGVLTSQLVYLTTVNFDRGVVSDVEFNRHKVDVFFKNAFIEGEFTFRNNFTLTTNISKRRLISEVQNLDFFRTYRTFGQQVIKRFKKNKISIEVGVGILF